MALSLSKKDRQRDKETEKQRDRKIENQRQNARVRGGKRERDR